MVDNYNQADFDRLKMEVESLVGRTIKVPKDFIFLERQIQGYTQATISVSTLKRMWGYVTSNSKPSRYNLDVLSRMVGYTDWEAFASNDAEVASSRFFVKSKLIAAALEVGEEVKLTWSPGRIVTIQYKGNGLFEVKESVNSKLAKGDTFICHQFVADEPLYLSNLQHIGMPSCNYVAGQNGGVKWNVGERNL